MIVEVVQVVEWRGRVQYRLPVHLLALFDHAAHRFRYPAAQGQWQAERPEAHGPAHLFGSAELDRLPPETLVPRENDRVGAHREVGAQTIPGVHLFAGVGETSAQERVPPHVRDEVAVVALHEPEAEPEHARQA
jgi:hypothetical protein